MSIYIHKYDIDCNYYYYILLFMELYHLTICSCYLMNSRIKTLILIFTLSLKELNRKLSMHFESMRYYI